MVKKPAAPAPEQDRDLPLPVKAEVTMQAAGGVPETDDQALWLAIRGANSEIAFDRYGDFIEQALCRDPESDRHRTDMENSLIEERAQLNLRPAIYGVDAYRILKLATEIFLLLKAGLVTDGAIHLDRLERNQSELADEASRLGREVTEEGESGLVQLFRRYFAATNAVPLPYLNHILRVALSGVAPEARVHFCTGKLDLHRANPALIELIWSYWHEEGMLAQTIKAISLRFQNRRGPADKDPLSELVLDPLRPLNNLLWGYIQDEYQRLSVVRRAYEYDHQYGLRLVGKAVPPLAAADSRSKFVAAFHHLLQRSTEFYRQEAVTVVRPDAFPLFNALREAHLLLAEGAHNQFGDLPWTARVEMLIEQWLLSRPEMREFLRGRTMVPYQEGWMGAVDAMKRLQGWTDVTITHFNNLAVFGERLLLSIRWGHWSDQNQNQERAKNWARYWKTEVQGYIHAYHAATGVDLSTEVTDVRLAGDRAQQPSLLMQRRLAQQRANGLPAPAVVARTASEALDYVEVPTARSRRLLPGRRQE